MRARTDDFTRVCQRMQALMQDPACTVQAPVQARLDDILHRLSQRCGISLSNAPVGDPCQGMSNYA